MFFVFLIIFTFPVTVRTICLFDNFEKLSILIEFSRDRLKVWARGCCARVFLVTQYKLGSGTRKIPNSFENESRFDAVVRGMHLLGYMLRIN